MCTETWPWLEPLNSHYDPGKDRHGDSHKHWPQGHLERGWTIMTETKVTQETWSLKERSLTACMIIETTLEQRCQTCRLLMLYKIQSGLAHCPTLKAKLVPLPSCQWCTHDKQLTLLTTRTQYRGSSFLPKTIRDWNLLPMKVMEAPTLDAFGSRVSNWKTTYNIPPPPPPPHILIPFMPDQYYSEHPQL